MKLKLVSDGLIRGNTRITNEETGELVECIEKVEILIDAYGSPKVVLTVTGMAIDVIIPCEDDTLDKLTKKGNV